MRRLTIKWVLRRVLLLAFSSILLCLIVEFRSYPSRFLDQFYTTEKLIQSIESVDLAAESSSRNQFRIFQGLPNLPHLSNANKKDWHNYTAILLDSLRIGFGEQGKRVFNHDTQNTELERKMSLENGFNAYLSDRIALNRSLPDIRYKG